MFKRLLQSLVKIYILAFRGLVLDTFQKLSRTTDSEQIPLKCMQLETVWERGMLTCRQISFLFEFPDTSSISHAMLAYVVCYIAREVVLSLAFTCPLSLTCLRSGSSVFSMDFTLISCKISSSAIAEPETILKIYGKSI